MYTLAKGPSKLVAQRRSGAQAGGGWSARGLADARSPRRSPAAAGGQPARRAPEMPAARAAPSGALAAAQVRPNAQVTLGRSAPRARGPRARCVRDLGRPDDARGPRP